MRPVVQLASHHMEGVRGRPIEGKDPLIATHATFGVKNPTLVFRCLGNGVEIDDVRVWTQKP